MSGWFKKKASPVSASAALPPAPAAGHPLREFLFGDRPLEAWVRGDAGDRTGEPWARFAAA